MAYRLLKSISFFGLFVVLSISIIPVCYAWESKRLVDTDSNGIKIVNVKKELDTDISGATLPPDHMQVNIGIDFIKNGVEWKLSALDSNIDNQDEVKSILSKVFLIDSEKHKYDPSYVRVSRWAGGSYSGVIFIVPKNSKNFQLGYQDLVPIDLDM